jgi:hypothetical protein
MAKKTEQATPAAPAIPDIIREKAPEMVAVLERSLRPVSEAARQAYDQTPPLPPATVPTASPQWDQPWWVVCWWAHKLPTTEKESGHPGTEQLRWSAPLPEEQVLSMLGAESIEWANANKSLVHVSHATIMAFGGTSPDDVEFLGVYGPDTPEFAAAHKWASNSRAMQRSRFTPPIKHP